MRPRRLQAQQHLAEGGRREPVGGGSQGGLWGSCDCFRQAFTAPVVRLCGVVREARNRLQIEDEAADAAGHSVTVSCWLGRCSSGKGRGHGERHDVVRARDEFVQLPPPACLSTQSSGAFPCMRTSRPLLRPPLVPCRCACADRRLRSFQVAPGQSAAGCCGAVACT